MNAEFQRQARKTPRLTHRLGGKVKIVLATFAVRKRTINFNDPESSRVAKQVSQAFALAVTQGRVEALRRSNLFDTITVETADVSDVSVKGYDYVLWQLATKPWTWRYRIAGREGAFDLVLPQGTQVPQFPAVVRDNIERTKASS
jgi:hypothetical protein